MMNKRHITHFGRSTVINFSALLGAMMTLFASGYFALRAFAATDTYIIHYDLNGGSAFSGTDVQTDGSGGYYSSKTNRNIVSAKPSTDKKLVFHCWRVITQDGSTKDYNPNNQIDFSYFSLKQSSEEGNTYEVTIKAIWYKPYRLICHYIDKNGNAKTIVTNKTFPTDDEESVITASNLTDSNYDSTNLVFMGWSKKSDGNGGKHMSYAVYQNYSDLISSNSLPLTEFGTWDETEYTNRLDLYSVFVDKINITYKDPVNGKTDTKKENPFQFSLLSKDNYISAVDEDSNARKGEFVYFYRNENFSGTQYNASTSISDVHQDATFFARWYYDMVVYYYNNKNASDISSQSSKRIRVVPVDDPESYELTMLPESNGGYSFKGWSTSRSGPIVTHMPANYLYLDSNGTSYTADFYAQWDSRSYVFEYDLNPVDKYGIAVPFDDISWNGPSTATFSEPANYSETKTYAEIEAAGGYTLPNPTALGYTFNGWKQTTYKEDGTSTGPTSRAGGATLPTSTFSATTNPPVRFTFTTDYWTKKYEMVVLPSANDGSEVLKQPSGWLSQSSADQEFVTYYLGTKPTREGYTFYGWSTSQSVDDMFCGDTANVKVPVGLFTEKLEGRFRVSVYPIWKTNITITYDANGGVAREGETTYSQVTQEANNVDAITLRNHNTVPKFERDGGYEFVEWNTKADGTGTSYADHQSGVHLTQDTTLYAIWVNNNITITYQANGGIIGDDPAVTSVQMTGSKVNSNTLRNYFTVPRFSYGENQFAEWNTQADGLGDSYQNAQQDVTLSEDTTFYAIWNRKYVLSYEKNTTDATGSSSYQNSKTVYNRLLRHNQDSLTMQTWNPSRVGYTFKGWSLSDDNDVTKILENNEIAFNQFNCKAEDPGAPDEKVYYATVYAVWKANEYDLFVDKNLPDGVVVTNIPEGGHFNYDEVRDGLSYDAPTAQGYKRSAVQLYDNDTNEVVISGLYVNTNTGKYTIASNNFVNHPQLKLKFKWKQLYRILYMGNLPSGVESIANGSIPNDTVFEEKSDGTAQGSINGTGNPQYTSADADGRVYYFKGWSETDDNNFTNGVRTGNVTHEEFLKAEGTPDLSMIQLGSLGSSKDEYRFTKKMYAVWKKQARLTFNLNGGYYNNAATTAPQVYTGTPDLTQNALDLGVKRTSYFLDGWNTKADGTGTHYDKGYRFILENQEDITLYAEWRYQGSYRIEFDSNKPSAEATVSSKSPVTVTVNESGSNDPFANEDNAWTVYYSSLSCKEARYGQNSNYYSFLQKGWTYEPYQPDSLSEEQMATLLVTEPSQHYISVPKDKFNTENLVTIDNKDYANVKLYAYWQKRGTLYIDANGGTLSGTTTARYVTIGNIYDLDLTTFPGDTPRREGYYWLGWNTRQDGSGTWYLSNKKADDASIMARIRAGFGDNPNVYRYQDEGVRYRGVNNYEGNDDGTKNILYAQWSVVHNYRIIFDMNTDGMPTPSKLLPRNGISDRLANEQSSNPFKTISGDPSGEKYWKFSTLTPYFYENTIPGYSDVMTYQFKGWSVEKYTPAQADEAVMSQFTVNDGREDATEDDPDVENIEITNLIPESFFYSDKAAITTVNGTDYLTVTLHAVWKTRAIVHFIANGGYRGRTDSPITEDYRLPGTIFTEDFNKFPGSPGYRRAYHKFIGYCTKTDGTGTWYLTRDQASESNLAKLRATYGDDLTIIKYMDGDEVLFEGKNNGKESNTLYAMWRKINNYRITFDINLPEVKEGEPEVTSSFNPQPQKASGNDNSDTPFIHEDENDGKYWKFSTQTPYARQDKYGKKNLQTYQFKGWSLYRHTADEALTAEIGYDVPDSSQDVDENTEGETVTENNSIQIANKVYKTIFNGDDEDVPVEVWEDENGKEYLSVEVHAVWKERAVLRLIANRNQKGQSDNDGESQYIFTGSIYKENITGMSGYTFTWKGHTFIGYNTKRDGSGTYYVTEYWKNRINNNHYLPDGWEDNAVIGTSSSPVFEGKDNGETPNVLYGQWVRNYALKYHLNYLDSTSDSWVSDSGNDYLCNVNYEMMDWTETMEDGTSSTTSVYPYHNLRDMLPYAKKQQANNKNYYFMGWSWEKVEGPVDSYDTSKIVDRAEFNDLYETDETKWHFKAPTGGDNKYRGDIYAVWSAEPYKIAFDRNTRKTDSDISKPKESHIHNETFPSDRELSYHDIVNGYTFSEAIPTADYYTFAADKMWNTTYIRKSNSNPVNGKVKDGSRFSLSTFRNAQDSTVTVIANWVPNVYHVHYGWEKYTNSSTSPATETDKVVKDYHYETAVQIADGVEPPDYSDLHVHFVGWELVSSEWAGLSADQKVLAADGATDIRELNPGDTFTMPGEDLYFIARYNADTVSVTYKPGEGTGAPVIEHPVYNSSHVVKTFGDTGFTPPENQSFSGWKLTIGGADSTKYTTEPGIPIEHLTDNIVYTAQYKDNLYTVKYELENGSADPNSDLAALLGTGSAYALPPESDPVKVGKTVQVADPLEVGGYIFTGWKLNGTPVGATVTMQSGGVTLTGTFEPVTYTLHYLTNRKAADSGTVDDSEVGEPVTFQRKNLQKDGTGEYYAFSADRTPETPAGYTFTGWSTTRTGEDNTAPKLYVVCTANPDSVSPYYVYGQWRNWNYLVQYQTAHGTAPDPQPFTLSEVMTGEARISQTVPAESGYDFLSWVISNGISKTFHKDDLSDNEKNVIPRALFVENAEGGSGVATAIAHWNKLYRLHFDLDGGRYEGGTKNSIDAKEFAFEEDVTSAKMSDIGVTLPTDMTKADGSTFDKWQLEIRDSSGNVTKTLTYNAGDIPLSEFILLDGRFTATLKALWKAPDAHEVTYLLTADSALQGTATPSEAPHAKDETFRVAQPLTAKGYTFSGWYQVENESDITDSTEEIRDAREFTMPAHDVTFWGRFTVNSYPVQYYDSNGTTQLTSFRKPYGTEITVGQDETGTEITPEMDGYHFVRWERMTGSQTTGSDGQEIPSPVTSGTTQTFRMPDGTVKYRAVYEKLYTLVYNANGGSNPLPASVNFAAQEKAGSTQPFDYTEATLPTREHYRFLGWNTSSEGTSRQESVTVAYGDSYSLDGDSERFIVPVYALWEGSCTVTYTVENAPEGYDVPESFRRFAGDQFPVEAVPELTGYDFSGWHYNDNGTDKVYANGETFTMPSKNVTFTGSFTPWIYTLFFKDSLTDADLGSQTVTYSQFSANGSGILIERNDPEKSGFTFKGWDKSKTSTAPAYQKGDSVTGFDQNRAATVYAIWAKDLRVTYEIRLLGGNNDPSASSYEVPVDETVYHPGDSVTVAPKLNVEGYEFHGWQKDGEDVTAFDMPSESVVLIGWFTKPGGDEVVHITYRSGIPKDAADYKPDMNEPYDVPITKGQPHKIIAHDSDLLRYVRDTTKYTFLGWKVTNASSGGSGTHPAPRSGGNDDGLMADGATIQNVDSSITLTGQWKEVSTKTFKLTYDGNGATSGNVPVDTTAYKGGESVLVAAQGNLARTGCTFKEWNTRKDGSGKGYRGGQDAINMPQSDVTLYAIWVNNDGKIVPSPGTGESNVPIALAFSAFTLSLFSIAVLIRRKHRNSAKA